MKTSAVRMAMPVTIEIIDSNAKEKDVQHILDYLQHIDDTFSTYKQTSEISKINRGELQEQKYSTEVKQVLMLGKQTQQETNGYFDIYLNGKLDPSGIVKGYAIYQAAEYLRKKGYKNFFVEIAGDVQVQGLNQQDKLWKVGIKNPFNVNEIVKIIVITNKGIATSGTYIRGEHIYNPISNKTANDIASITVIGPNIYEADRFATAAFAMGEKSIQFIEELNRFEGYMIKKDKQAIMTSGFEKYVM